MAGISHKVGGCVLLATCFWDSILIGIFIDNSWVSSIAGTTCFAVYYGLRTQGYWCGTKTLIEDVESISNSRGSSLGPTRPTVIGDVLVSIPGAIVDSINISPVKVLGEGCSIYNIPRHLTFSDLSQLELDLLHTLTCAFPVAKEGALRLGSTFWLGHGWVSGVVHGVIALSIGGDVLC